MPYVVGTYRDKFGTLNSLLHSEPRTVSECCSAIRWQGETDGRSCAKSARGDQDMRTVWHIADPDPAEPFVLICRKCGARLRIRRGAFTWEAFHRIAREMWGSAIPATVFDLRMSMGGL